MTFDDFQEGTKSTANATADVANWAISLGEEAGEVQGVLKKHLYHGMPLDREHLAEELGDLLWYVAALASSFDLSLNDVAKKNQDKLRKRYPVGFQLLGGIR